MVSSNIQHSSLGSDLKNVIQHKHNFWKVKLLMSHFCWNTKQNHRYGGGGEALSSRHFAST